MESATTPSEEESRNYFGPQGPDADALKYRLDGEDVIKRVVDTLRGGFFEGADGRKVYREEYRLMNDEGISRVEMTIRSGVNKVIHLTKYKNEERILRQVKELARAFAHELVANIKRWGPIYTTKVSEDDYEDWYHKTGVVTASILVEEAGVLTVMYRVKVRTKHLVPQLIENGILAGMQRGEEGFENTNLGKTYNVNEIIDRERRREQESGLGRFNIFSRGAE